MRGIFRAAACFLSLLLAAGMTVFAASPVTVPISVTQKGETGYVQIRTKEGKDAGMVLAGSKSPAAIRLVLQEPGTYKYTVSQTRTLEEDCTMDDTVYQLTIYVENGSDGKLVSTVVVTDQNQMKVREIVFDNEKKEETTATEATAGTTETPEEYTWTNGVSTEAKSTGTGASGSTASRPTGDGTRTALWIAGGCALLTAAFLPMLIRAWKKKKSNRTR